MHLKITQTKRAITRKATFGKRDNHTLGWGSKVCICDIDNTYVRVDAPTTLEVALARAFSFHLKTCGLLDGYHDSVFVNGNYRPDFLCKVSFAVRHGSDTHRAKAEFRYLIRSDHGIPGVNIDKETVSAWLYDCVLQREGRDALFDMRMRHALILHKIQCYVDDLEIEM